MVELGRTRVVHDALDAAESLPGARPLRTEVLRQEIGDDLCDSSPAPTSDQLQRFVGSVIYEDFNTVRHIPKRTIHATSINTSASAAP